MSATRRLALLRSAQGPWIPTSRITKPKLKVTGLDGCTVSVHHIDAEGQMQSREFEDNGVHELVPAYWTRVSCEPLCPTLICEITS